MKDIINVIGISGSLRKNSVNRGLLRTAQEVLPDDMVLEMYELTNIPLYNEDLMATGIPEAVKEFKVWMQRRKERF